MIKYNDYFELVYNDSKKITTSKYITENMDKSLCVKNIKTCLDFYIDSNGKILPLNEKKVFFRNDREVIIWGEVEGVIYNCPLYLEIRFDEKIILVDILELPCSQIENNYHRTFLYSIFTNFFIKEGYYSVKLKSLTGKKLSELKFYFKNQNRSENIDVTHYIKFGDYFFRNFYNV